MGVKFYSTSFVFLKDTFASKFLCFCDFGKGHYLGNDASVMGCVPNIPR
jgi:hypothetical protein